MSEEKLKPCPFCEPEKSDPELIDHRTDWFVRCNGCNVVVYGETVNHLDHINDEDEAQAAFDAVDWDTLRKTAIDKWNARASLPPTQELLRLKELECEQLAKDKKEFIRFANGAIFTMGKAKKHNELSSHDDEMIRQRIEQAKQLLERIG